MTGAMEPSSSVEALCVEPPKEKTQQVASLKPVVSLGISIFTSLLFTLALVFVISSPIKGSVAQLSAKLDGQILQQVQELDAIKKPMADQSDSLEVLQNERKELKEHKLVFGVKWEHLKEKVDKLTLRGSVPAFGDSNSNLMSYEPIFLYLC